jgi:acyl-CoA thioesterase-1
MLIKSIILLFLFIFFNEKKNVQILCFGDSLTAGYGLDITDAWASLLQKKVAKNIFIKNAGLSGETSAGGLRRIDWLLNEPVDILILELGANDALRGLSVEETEKNLQAIINKVKKKYPNVKIILCGMEAPPNMGELYSNKFKSVFSSLAKINKTSLIPFFLVGVAGNPKLNLDDRVHPNKDGQKIVMETVYKYLKPMIN